MGLGYGGGLVGVNDVLKVCCPPMRQELLSF
jgi:hypothetical protein